MAEAALLKHQLGVEAVAQLRELLSAVYPAFNGKKFEQQLLDRLEALELKQRVAYIIEALAEQLPTGFCQTAHILENIADSWPADADQRNWTSFAAWPLIDYVAIYGLNYPQRAFAVLERLTPLFTAEFAIRPFLQQHFDLTYQQMQRWTQHDDEHVRRLVSEGSRPRLPWASQLKFLRDDPEPIWPLLDALKADPSLYVRRSVANNLNDISKDHPEQVLEKCRQWQQHGNKDIDWVIRHGLRTLVKAGHPAVYPLLGFSDKPELKKLAFATEQTKLKLGESLVFSLELEAGQNTEKLVVDYRIVFAKANGGQGSKVFKWKNISLQPGERLRLEKSHSFRPISTRRYYRGQHLIECLVNGKVMARASFELVVK